MTTKTIGVIQVKDGAGSSDRKRHAVKISEVMTALRAIKEEQGDLTCA